MNDITIPPEAVEAAARAIIIANGGDPDALLRLTIYKTTRPAWQQVAPLARAALAAGLAAWPDNYRITLDYTNGPTPMLVLPLPTENSMMEQTPDLFGRVWMHCESGLSMTKASMARFMMFVLANKIEIGTLYAFSPTYKGSLVLASVKLKPEQFEAFERETGGKLREPVRVQLNSEGTQ